MKKANRTHHRASGGSAISGSKNSEEKQSCKRCGKNHGPTDKCPAMKATCYKCNHKGHFSSQCLANKPATACTNELTIDTFLGVMSTTRESSWIISMKTVVFQAVSTISHLAYKTLGNSTPKKPAKILPEIPSKFWVNLIVLSRLVKNFYRNFFCSIRIEIKFVGITSD